MAVNRLKSRKIAAVTGSRAEYGLLHPVLQRIHQDPSLQLQLIVTGTHLAKRFGETVREIEADGLPIAARVTLHLDARLATSGARLNLVQPQDPERNARAMALAIRGFGRAFGQLRPDLLILLGDRFEVLAAAATAMPFRLPVAHLHGGESSEGVWDESIRHAVTKLSHLHFPAHPLYARRIRQMGEDPRRIFCFGSPLMDRLREIPRLDLDRLSELLGTGLERPIGVVTFHPETLDPDAGLNRLRTLLAALRRTRATWILTYPNADAGRDSFLQEIERFATSPGQGQARVFRSLGQLRYLNLLRHADVMVGNSSSGILEAPHFGLPVVNLGDRQEGRLRGPNVLDVPEPDPAAISRAIQKALSPRFRKESSPNPSGNGHLNPSAKIVRVLKTVRLGEDLLKKKFHELPNPMMPKNA